MDKRTAVVRIERFRELAPGGHAAVVQLIDLFLEQMREQMARLRDAIDRNAIADVELIAHRTAGTSATCGADLVAPPLLELERLAGHGQLAGAGALADAATAAFARTEDFLLGYLVGFGDCQRHG